MNDNKKEYIGIRLNKKEKEMLEEKAEKQCMTLSQYVRECALEKLVVSAENTNNYPMSNKLPKNFTDEMFNRLMRMMVSAYARVNALSQELLEEEEYNKVDEEIDEVLAMLDIEKEGYGSNVKKY